MNISGPHQRAVFLAARPCAAQQIDDLLLSFRLHSVEEGLRVHHRIDVSDLHVRSQMIAIVFKVIDGIFRLGLVQPEDLHAFVIVILFDLAPDIFAGFRIGRVKLDGVAHVGVVDAHTLFHSGKKALCLHLGKVLALVVHHRPHGDHQLDAHLLQLCDHGVGIRPVCRVEAPVALFRPVEEVHDDDIQRDLSAFVFSCHFQKLFLGLITQLALPEAKAVFRHHRHFSGCVRIGFLDLGRGISRSDPIVKLLGGSDRPGGDILVEVDAADAGVVPQEAVSQGRKHKRNTRLRIAVCQLELGAFDVEERLLILAHAVQFFVRVRFEPHGQLIVAADDRFELTAFHLERAGRLREHILAVADILFQKKLALLIIEEQLADVVDDRPDLSVFDGSAAALDRHLRFGRSRVSFQGPELVGHLGHFGCAHSQAVRAPGFNDHTLRVIAIAKRAVLLFKISKQKVAVRAKIAGSFSLFFSKIRH